MTITTFQIEELSIFQTNPYWNIWRVPIRSFKIF